MIGMVASMINSSVSNNLFQPEGGPIPKYDTDIFNVMPIKKESPSKRFSSFRTVKDTVEGFTKPVLQEYVVLFL